MKERGREAELPQLFSRRLAARPCHADDICHDPRARPPRTPFGRGQSAETKSKFKLHIECELKLKLDLQLNCVLHTHTHWHTLHTLAHTGTRGMCFCVLCLRLGCGRTRGLFIMRRLPPSHPTYPSCKAVVTLPRPASRPHTYTPAHTHTCTHVHWLAGRGNWKLNEACVIDFMFVKNGRKRSRVGALDPALPPPCVLLDSIRLTVRRFGSIEPRYSSMAFDFN